MVGALIIILAILWFLGYIHIGGVAVPNIPLFTLNSQVITLWDVLILLVLATIVGVLPSPFRQIAGVILIFWILSVLGILVFAGLSSLLVLAVVVGLIFYALGGAFL